MENLSYYKRRIIIGLSILLFICLLSIIFSLASSPFFSNSVYPILLLVTFILQIPLTLIIGLTGIKAISLFIKTEKNRKAASLTAEEEYEKEVEEKVKEANELVFNVNRLVKETGKKEDWTKFANAMLTALSNQIEIVTGIVYQYIDNEDFYKPIATYAYYSEEPPIGFKTGDGLAGQVAKDNKAIFLTELPKGNLKVISGLGQVEPNNLTIFPILRDNVVIGLIEIATFKPFEKGFINKIDEISRAIGTVAPF
jgi:hypothetical protein